MRMRFVTDENVITEKMLCSVFLGRVEECLKKSSDITITEDLQSLKNYVESKGRYTLSQDWSLQKLEERLSNQDKWYFD